jgi:Hint domain
MMLVGDMMAIGSAFMSELQTKYNREPKGSSNWHRTRRNILAIGGILSGAILGGANSAKADDSGWDWNPFHHHHHHHERCFLRGTRVLTPSGERRVEDLAIGDAIVTLRSESKIDWIGHRSSFRSANECAWPSKTLPVHFAKGALAPNLPHSDLWVSQEHALLLDGLAIRAVELLNGTSITIDACENASEIEYFHVKVSDGGFIFAEGVPSESLVFGDAFGIGGFDNIEAFDGLYGPPSTSTGARDVVALGRRERIKSHLRSALSPWIDRRTKFDRVRDRLQERADRLAA